MKVLIVGGYGVFGERLARLLVRDGHAVVVAGRRLEPAERLAKELGCGAQRFDRGGDLSGIAGFDVVVDAAGPFHLYGTHPYALTEAAIAAGVHYLDLSDNADFCAGISALDAAAQKAGVCVLSGLSSVPAISSAAVEALAHGAPIARIDSAILPGNRSPRGLSVMQSILEQTGRPLQVWQGGQWQQRRGWSSPQSYLLPRGVKRQGWLIEVPDLRLFPAHFGAQTVLFRAGLELGVMRYGLATLALLRRVLPFPVGGRFLRLMKGAADLLAPFGSGVGGMSVMVQVAGERRFWRLLAEDGEGPFVPAVAARALLRRKNLPVGAAPALSALRLEEIEVAMSDLAITTERVTEPSLPLIPQVLGARFKTLPPQIRATHKTTDCSRFEGAAQIETGSGLWSQGIRWVFGFPPAGRDVPVRVTKTVTPRGETWERQIGTRHFRSYMALRQGGLTERFGPLRFRIDLSVGPDELAFPVSAGWCGPIPLPRRLLPKAEAREYVEAGRFCFDVALHAPLTGGVIVRYRGFLTAQPPESPVQK